jgi:tetraacyldisaccharide 4'-kinase
MRVRTPEFWYDTQSTEAKAKAATLSSLSTLYAIGHILHQKLARPQSAGIPVICIGNLTAGGSGKTPAALAIMPLVQPQFKNPCFLSRGYGGTLTGPVCVDPALHSAADVGDEALLLAVAAPTIISADRLAGARFAKDRGHDIVVMDDGLQNPKLKKDISIVVIDGAMGFGNGLLLPAGPLRTPISKGMALADIVLLIGNDTSNALAYAPKGKSILNATAVPLPPKDPAPLYYAFCGIAHPDKFRHSLEEAGLKIAGFQSFPDHYPYAQNDLNNLSNKAKALNSRLITTSKDAVRIHPDLLNGDFFDILGVSLQFSKDSQNALAAKINEISTT